MTSRESLSWFLGIDLGTSSCKSIAVAADGTVLSMGTATYPSDTVSGKWQEQDPEVLVEGLVRSAHEAVTTAGVPPEACAGASIGGPLHSLLAVDDTGRPLTGVITWADGRAARQAAAFREQPEAQHLYQETGCPVHGMFPLYKIIWLRQERPQIFARAARFIAAKTYVVARLTGAYVVDYCTAAGSGLLNTHTLGWNPRSLEVADTEERQLSSLGSPSSVLPPLDTGLAARIGIPRSTPLVLGSSDAANSSLGAGAVTAKVATCMIGTSGAFRVITRQPVLDPDGQVWCYAIDAGHWLVGGAINNGGLALSWLRDLVNGFLPEAAYLSFGDLLELAARAEPGAGGLLCLPFFAGERSPNWNLDARALFFGMTLEHGAEELARALLEGIGFRFRSVRQMLADAGLEVEQIRASGGFTRSPFWLQLMASLLDRELLVPGFGETSAFGAAFWAMFANGRVTELEAVARFVQTGERYHPEPEQVARYHRLYELYRLLYRQMRLPFAEVAALQQELARAIDGGNGRGGEEEKP